MGGWTRQKGDTHNQEISRTRSQYKKPPIGNWQPTVPSWEKKFCRSVCLMTWEEILETKKFMHLFQDIVRWNDSAGEEAFHNAKTRFYAEMHGLPCDISLPDPDIYIDKIDWDSKIDPELLLDLERGPVVCDAEKKEENVVIFGNFLSNQGFSTAGWGDSEEEIKGANNPSWDNNNPWESKFTPGPLENEIVKATGWGDMDNAIGRNDNNGDMGTGGWQVGWNNSSYGWYQHKNTNYQCLDVKDSQTNGWGTWEVENAKRDDTYGCMPRYKTSRFHHGDVHQGNHAWRIGKARMRGNSFRNYQQIKAPLQGHWP